MYYPYFRGKQFELMTIRENAQLMAKVGFTPIIEPVRELLALEKAVLAVSHAGGNAVVIVNPDYGAHQGDGTGISTMLRQRFGGNSSISAGVLLTPETTEGRAVATIAGHRDQDPTTIHAGFASPRNLAQRLQAEGLATPHVFVESFANTLYRRHFEGSIRVLVRDGFKRRTRNRDYPESEDFSELHLTYKDLGAQGFGDFLIVGDDFAENGGPAYAVAIHLTFIDSTREHVMRIYHFVSDSRDTPTDPAGKFAQALDKMIRKIDGGDSNILETEAVREFRDLHKRGHFPGLGYVKKLSMNHHIQTLAHHFG